MLNKDKRSLLMCLILGDGCLYAYPGRDSWGGKFIIEHCESQRDYLRWKAQLVSTIYGRQVKQKYRMKTNAYSFELYSKRFRIWYKFCYPNRIKHRGRILHFIRHPELALAIWLMDDGYVEPSITNAINYSAAFRIFTCSSRLEDHDQIIGWFEDNFGIVPKIRWQYRKKDNKKYPFLKINVADSLRIWAIIRDFVLSFEIMRYKFRYIEQIYQSRCLQPPTTQLRVEDIVHSLSN